LKRFGAQLKKAREQRGITLDEISLSTKIGVRFLSALEEEHFERLPGGIFNKGFVRSYARTLGIDENQAIVDYLAASGESQPKKPGDPSEETPPLPAAAATKREHSLSQFSWSSLATPLLLVLLVVLLGFLAFQLRRLNISKRHEVAEPVVASQHSQPAVPADREPSNQNQFQPPTPTPATFTVKIKATDESWLSVTADGKEVMQDTLAAEEEKSIAARKEIVIKAGNIGGLDLWFNGSQLPSQGENGNVRTLTFDANGLRPPEHKKTVVPE
jgi:cytoskeletal protein RodZ